MDERFKELTDRLVAVGSIAGRFSASELHELHDYILASRQAVCPAGPRVLEAHDMINVELGKAEAKFPTWPNDPIHAAAVVAEEAGELVQAALQVTYEGGSIDAMRKEAVQVGAMAVRFLLMLRFMDPQPSEQVDRAGRVRA